MLPFMEYKTKFDHLDGRMIPCADAALYVEEAGRADGPALFLLHGGFGTVEDFNPLCRHLADSYRLIGVDTRGHGRSSLGSEPLSYERLRGDLETVVESFGLESYGILGFSDGGIAAYRFAATRPKGLRALAAVGASWELSEADGAYGMVSGMSAALWKRFFPKTVKRYRELQGEADWEGFAEQVLAMWRDLGESGHPGAAMKRIPIPFLAVRGEEDRLTSLESYARLRGLTKKLRFLNLPFAGHAAFEDEPDLVGAVLRTYLAERFSPEPKPKRRV